VLKKRIISKVLLLAIILSLLPFMPTTVTASSSLNPNVAIVTPEKRVHGTSGGFLPNGAFPSGLLTVVMPNGTITVMDRENAIAYEFSTSLKLVRTVTFPKPLLNLGTFTRDEHGNFFLFFGQPAGPGAFTERNMVLRKYSSNGSMIAERWMQANADPAAGTVGGGARTPFGGGTARMEISGNIISVYFARGMFPGADGVAHQASDGFMFDVNTLEQVLIRSPYVSHSFNHFVLPVQGGFLYANHGDAYPRCFTFTRVGISPETRQQINSFRFPGNIGNNYTGAELGGLAKTSSGFLFSGTFHKNFVGSATVPSDFTSSRNLFLQIISDDMTTISDPIWITNYTDPNFHAVNPQIVSIGNNEYLVLWEELTQSTWSQRTLMAIVNESGAVISAAKEIPGIPLNGNDVLRYSQVTERVYWAICDDNGRIVLMEFNPRAAINPPDLSSPFIDVLSSSVAFDAINWASNNSIVTGTNDGRFLPGDNMTREQYALVLWRYMGRPSPGAGRTFVDVPASSVAFNAISWASANGIVTGRGDSFLPKDNMTRAEMVLMMYRCSRLYGKNLSYTPDALNPFSDRGDVPAAALDAMRWAVTHRLVTGNAGRLLPNDPVTREQVVLILYRYVHGIGA